jgi:hypothetical protein
MAKDGLRTTSYIALHACYLREMWIPKAQHDMEMASQARFSQDKANDSRRPQSTDRSGFIALT